MYLEKAMQIIVRICLVEKKKSKKKKKILGIFKPINPHYTNFLDFFYQWKWKFLVACFPSYHIFQRGVDFLTHDCRKENLGWLI